ncbi:MAG: hypothetical protein [Microviridae sp.]|nr:MAG: hypothetical protein [Microviridae sp.]
MKNEKSLFEVHESRTEPFRIVEKDEEFTILMGENIISTKRFESLENAESYIESKPYDIILNSSLLYCRMGLRLLDAEDAYKQRENEEKAGNYKPSDEYNLQTIKN